jgi:hypothetical protein
MGCEAKRDLVFARAREHLNQRNRQRKRRRGPPNRDFETPQAVRFTDDASGQRSAVWAVSERAFVLGRYAPCLRRGSVAAHRRQGGSSSASRDSGWRWPAPRSTPERLAAHGTRTGERGRHPGHRRVVARGPRASHDSSPPSGVARRRDVSGPVSRADGDHVPRLPDLVSGRARAGDSRGRLPRPHLHRLPRLRPRLVPPLEASERHPRGRARRRPLHAVRVVAPRARCPPRDHRACG